MTQPQTAQESSFLLRLNAIAEIEATLSRLRAIGRARPEMRLTITKVRQRLRQTLKQLKRHETER